MGKSRLFRFGCKNECYQIQGNGTNGGAGLGGQSLQPVQAAGDEPQLVELLLLVQGQDELPSHARGCTRNDGDLLARNVHEDLLQFTFSWSS